MEYYVINKKGEHVELDFNKVLFRLLELKNMKPKLNVNVPLIAQNTIKMMVNEISTKELDEISINFCASMITNDLDYDKMAVRLLVDNLHRETENCYLKTITNIENYSVDGEHISILNPKLIKFVNNYYSRINETFDFEMDYKYTYFGIKTLMKSYLLKHSSGENYHIKERPQHMLMRVSIGLNINSIDKNGQVSENIIESIFHTYKLMSKKYYTHATPTLFNSGTHRQAMSSCFLLSVDDSLSNIYKTLTDTAMISKWSGGVGIHVSQVRATNSIIRSTNGKSEGIVPMLKMYNDSAVYVSQGGGKRKGSTAVYLETWHADIFDFLDLKKPVGDESRRARDLFLALWICDLFMERLEKAIYTGEEVMWSLFCPSKAKGLADVYGEEYRKLYLKYENDKIWNRQVSITKLWTHILEIQMESGVPYISYKDHVNRKNNQNNLGTIKSSNLCVSGDTQILTDSGYYKIKDLEGHDVNIWNGEQFSETTVHLTGTDKELLKLDFSNGASMNCTPYHKFFIQKEGKEIKVEAKDLQKYDKISKCEYPTIDVRNNDENLAISYTSGYYTSSNKDGCIVAYHSKNILNHALKYKSSKIDKSGNKWYSMYKEVINEMNVPVNKSLKYKTEWLSGFIDGCGVISSNKQVFTTHLINGDITLLNNVRMLCNTMGMNPKISGEKLLFSVKDTIYMYKELKINPYIICYNGKFTDFLFNNTNVTKDSFIYVKSIKKIDGLHNTYCFNEKLKNRGVFNGILASNCNEINIYTDKDNIGVCNLASICLSKFVEKRIDNDGIPEKFYNYEKLHSMCKLAICNLNKVIDNNVYPVKEGESADIKNRPVGLGVQSLAKVFFKMGIPFVCDKSKEINKKIFETMYHASVEASCELAKENGVYETYSTSMMAKGILQPDLWGVTPSDLWNWPELRNKVKKYGVRNSLLLALMPTASTAQIMGNTESFEPISSNIFVRNTLSGTFQVVNKYLVRDLKKLNLWNEEMKQRIIAMDGSVQHINNIPSDVKQKYLTIWEIKQKDLIDLEADRNCYVCQSTSSNRYLKNPDNAKLTSMHMYAWKKGLKTGMYYLRSQSAVNAVKFNVDTQILKEQNEIYSNNSEEEECLMCSA
jgi:ribonucleoside-diphosphate reductase alpha chain